MKKIFLPIFLVFLWFYSWQVFSQVIDSTRQYRIDSLKKALSLARDDSSRIKMRCGLGYESKIYRSGYWDSILNDAHRHNLSIIEVRALDRLGYTYRIQGKSDVAESYFKKSIKLAEAGGYLEEMYMPFRGLWGIYYLRNDIKQSLECCYKCLKIGEELKDKKKIANSYIMLGAIYFRSGELEKALQQNQKVMTMAMQYHLTEEIVEALLGIGTDYRDLGKMDSAVKYYLMSKPYARELGETSTTSNIYISVAAAYDLTGQFDSAEVYCLRAYELSEKVNNKTQMVSAMVLLSENSYKRGDMKKAKKHALKGLEMINAIGFKGQIPTHALTLKNIYEKEGNYKEALKYYELSINTRDSVNNEKTKRETLEKQFEYDLEKKDNANKLLAQQNQIQLLQLSKDRYLMVGLVISLLLLLAISIIFFRQNKIRSEQQRIQLQQKLLRSQMAPHFIFNSLQAIQNFILKKDEKMAVKYLSSFASLIRSVLESSRMDYIQLGNEILLLEKYLEIQKLRFGNRFDYKIDVDENIDRQQVEIPPMLCQPFIENAIEHGMRDIEKGGLVTISYVEKGNVLLIEIVDNGYGISIKDPNAKKHQSLAIEITKERISLMNEKRKEKTTFDIAEAFPMEKENKGVKVCFSIPL